MGSIATIVIPVFCLIGLGFAAVRCGYLKPAVGEGVTEFVVKFAIPILLIKSLATAEFSGDLPWAMVAIYFGAIVAAWLPASFLIHLVWKRDMRASSIAGVAASFSNLVLLGIPLIQLAYGQPGLQVLFVLLSVHLIFMMTASSFAMEWAVRADGVDVTAMRPLTVMKSLAKNLAVNPIIVGIVTGVVIRLSGLPLPGFVLEVLDLVSRCTGPLALIALGMGLVKYGFRGNLPPAAALTFLSLVVMPATVVALQQIVQMPTLWFQVALLGASCPTGVNAYLIASYFRTGEGLATNTIVMALMGSIITIPFWLWVGAQVV